MLIFENKPGTYIAKVADFGFSTHFQGEQDLVKMSKSVPWNAPEHHYRHFNPSAAKRIDIYSFGLLCFWVVFGASLDALPLPPQTASDKGQFTSFEEHLLELNLAECRMYDSNNELSEWATWLVMESGDFKNGIDEKLAQFFNLTLAYKPEERCIDFEQLLNLLAPNR